MENLTLEDYDTVMRPKVYGTWDLYRPLAKDIDFFIMLLSFFIMLLSESGIIGKATKAAHIAGSTFLDGFALYRNPLSFPATTLDLGIIIEISHPAENKALAEGIKRRGFESTDEESLMAPIHSEVVEPRRQGGLAPIVMGVGSWKEGTSLCSFHTPPFAHFPRRVLG